MTQSLWSAARAYHKSWAPWARWNPEFLITDLLPEETRHIAAQQNSPWGGAILTSASHTSLPAKSSAYSLGDTSLSRIRGPSIRIIVTSAADDHPIILAKFARYAMWMASLMRSQTPLIRIFYWDVATPRRLPARGQAIHPIHVNGGASFQCNTTGINVYRSEEASRVILHELIHALCGDVDTTAIDDTICDMVHGRSTGSLTPSPDMHLLEAHTEAKAEWCYLVTRYGHSRASFIRAWTAQLRYAEVAASHLLHHFGRAQITDVSALWKEGTGAFAYFVMRLALLHHILSVVKDGQATVDLWPTWLAELDASLSPVSMKQRMRKTMRRRRLTGTRRRWVNRPHIGFTMISPELQD